MYYIWLWSSLYTSVIVIMCSSSFTNNCGHDFDHQHAHTNYFLHIFHTTILTTDFVVNIGNRKLKLYALTVTVRTS